MHDRTLQRTTNVHEVFPNRTGTPAAMFTWAELESLNAGAWFLSVSPTQELILDQQKRLRVQLWDEGHVVHTLRHSNN